MLRIDDIVLTPDEDPADPPPPKPVRLLDLWANRWLDAAEKEGIEMVDGEDGQIPKTALIYVTWNLLSFLLCLIYDKI